MINTQKGEIEKDGKHMWEPHKRWLSAGERRKASAAAYSITCNKKNTYANYPLVQCVTSETSNILASELLLVILQKKGLS